MERARIGGFSLWGIQNIAPIKILSVTLFFVFGLLGVLALLFVSLKAIQEQEVLYEKNHALHTVLHNAGYGAAIHRFKNYILRANPVDYDISKSKFDLVVNEIDHVLGRKIWSAGHETELLNFRTTMVSYQKALEIARERIENNTHDPRAIDELVKIDDSSASDSLRSLISELELAVKAEFKRQNLWLNLGLALAFIALVFGALTMHKLIDAQESSRLTALNNLEMLKVSEQKLSASSAELELVNEELENFTQRVAHDIRAPLRRIKMFSQIVAEEMGDEQSEELRFATEKIRTQTLSLEQLVDGLLNLARSESESQFVADGPQEVRHAVDESIARLSMVIGEHRTHVSVDCDALVVNGNEFRLGQILDNLISNACKYGNPDDSKVWVSAHEKDGKLELVVSDNGLGIPKKYHAELFGLFKRFDPKRAEGNGIGLSIVKRHVEHMGGNIHYRDGSTGAEFVARLPLHAQSGIGYAV